MPRKFQINVTQLKILTGRRQISWVVLQSVTEDLKSGLPRNKNPAGGTVDAENPETTDYNTSALKLPRWLIKFFPHLQNPLIYNWAHNLLLRNICID